MNTCGKGTTVARFSGRKNQAHNGKWCYISCQAARHNSKIPIPNRCGGGTTKRRKSSRRR